MLVVVRIDTTVFGVHSGSGEGARVVVGRVCCSVLLSGVLYVLWCFRPSLARRCLGFCMFFLLSGHPFLLLLLFHTHLMWYSPSPGVLILIPFSN